MGYIGGLLVGWVATDRKRDAKIRRIPSRNARIWQIRAFFALREGRVRFGADLFNRTDRCTFSPSSSSSSSSSAAAATAAAAAQQKKRQIALVSAICAGTAVAICTSRT